jgi:hypothetical protein
VVALTGGVGGGGGGGSKRDNSKATYDTGNWIDACRGTLRGMPGRAKKVTERVGSRSGERVMVGTCAGTYQMSRPFST